MFEEIFTVNDQPLSGVPDDDDDDDDDNDDDDDDVDDDNYSCQVRGDICCKRPAFERAAGGRRHTQASQKGSAKIRHASRRQTTQVRNYSWISEKKNVIRCAKCQHVNEEINMN